MTLIKVINGYKRLGTKDKKKVSLHNSQAAFQNGAYPGFYSMRQLGIFLLSPLMGCESIAGLCPALNLPVPTYTPRLREALSE